MPSKEKFTILARATTAKGVTFALCHLVNSWGEDTGYGVWKLSENYSAGKMVKSWRYVQMKMTEEAAAELFRRKTGGPARTAGT